MNQFNFRELCDCIASIAVASMDVLNGDVDVSPEELAKNPAAGNNIYYNNCSEYAYVYCLGANAHHEGGKEIRNYQNLGYPCDEDGTCISQEEWDAKYEYKEGRVIRK